MPTKTESIRAFLLKKTHSDLANLYNHDMEVQVNVGQDGGQRVKGDFMGRIWQGFTDGIQTWKPIRIPWNANTVPEYEDSRSSFDIEAHAEGIGMTGWDWKNRCSRWVGFDFDAISGHSEKHQKKLTDQELSKIQADLKEIPWTTLRYSTSGKGIHLYVFLNPTVTTQNHNEHAALARAILGKLSAIVGYDFNNKVDTCGQNLWVWHRKMTPQNRGLTLIKQGTTLEDIPSHWQDHVKVITSHRKRTLPKFLGQEDSTPAQKFDELAGQLPRVNLDEDHKVFLKWIEEHDKSGWWDSDHHMLVTHTYWLAKAYEELGMQGEFRTISKGTEVPNDINCYMFPMRKGGWSVRRYSLGCAEADTWDQDAKGWTRCYFNVPADLNIASRIHSGIEDPSGGYVFNEAEMAAEAARMLGVNIPEIPSGLKSQRANLKTHKDGRIVFEIEGDREGIVAQDMKGWLKKKNKYVRLFNVSNPTPNNEAEGSAHDEIFRHLISSNGDAGWAIRGDAEKWRREPLKHINHALEAMGMKASEIKIALGNAILRGWTLVNKPFQPEYPGNRTWNEQSAQLKYVPSQNEDLSYPHWNKIFRHIGSSLDPYIQANPWCKLNGIADGSDYLRLWVASIFKEPLEPLPYLFLYGPQNSGKSILHEALSLLLTRGYTRADNALVNQSGFNEELANAVLCVVEEVDLRRDKNAANRIKDLVTARELSIHPKGRTPYHATNSTHWIQTSNQSSACPIFPGDTRITMIYVPEIELTEMIPKKVLLDNLEREAPDFLASLLRVELPAPNDRLNIPVITTADKSEAEAYNRTPVETFLAENYYYVPGEVIRLGILFDRFLGSLDASEVGNWTKQKFGRELPPHFPKGRSTTEDSQLCVGNISANKPDSNEIKKQKLVAKLDEKNGYIFLRPETNGQVTNDFDSKNLQPTLEGRSS